MHVGIVIRKTGTLIPDRHGSSTRLPIYFYVSVFWVLFVRVSLCVYVVVCVCISLFLAIDNACYILFDLLKKLMI